jgi:hypothetical protein
MKNPWPLVFVQRSPIAFEVQVKPFRRQVFP